MNGARVATPRTWREVLRALFARRSPAQTSALVAILCALLFLVDRGAGEPVTGSLERASLDARFVLRGPRPSTSEVVIVAFDGETALRAPDLAKRRKHLARLVDAIDRAGASVIVLDFFMDVQEEPLPSELLEALRAVVPELPDDGPPDRVRALLERVFDEVRGDEALAESVERARRVVLALHLSGREGKSVSALAVDKALFPVVVPGEAMPLRADRGMSSLPLFVDAADALGLVSLSEDRDGRSRNIYAALSPSSGGVAMPLAVAAVALHRSVPREQIVFSARDETIRVGDTRIDVDDGALHLNFRGRAPSVETISAIDVVLGRTHESALAGKIVLVGLTTLVDDRVATPFGAGSPGVEIHATAIDNLLRDDFVRRAPLVGDFALALVAGLSMALLFVRRERLSAPVLLVVAVALAALFAVATFAAFALFDVWLSSVGTALTQGAALFAALLAAYLDDGLERMQLRRAFSRYLSQELLDTLLHAPERVSLSGERRVLTVLFSDIRNFTSMAEGISPDALAALLTRYFTPMTRAVLASRGYLDKYIGDAIMAVFGAPVFHDDHAQDACRAAVAMHRALATLKRELAAEGITLDIGIGLNTGEMVVGNMGSSERFDYTVLGDAVNLASRIEGLTKEYGVFCLVGADTAARARGAFRFRTVDLVRVKGKERAVEIFELLGDDTHSIVAVEALDRYERGVEAYRAGDLERATSELEQFARVNRDDPLAALYLERIHAHRRDPSHPLDSVTTFTKK